MNAWSIRSRLLFGTLFIAITALLITGISFFLVIRATAVREFDLTLLAKAHGLAGSFELEGNEVELEGRLPGEFYPSSNAEYFQLWINDRSMLRSPSLRKSNQQLQTPTVWEKLDKNRTVYFNATLPDGRVGRMVAVPFQPNDWRQPDENEIDDECDDDELFLGGASDLRMTLVVARSTEQLASLINRVAFWLAALGLIFTAAVIALLSWFINRSLSPLKSLSQQLNKIDQPESLEPIAVADAPTEIEPVVSTVNALLARLENAFEIEKSLSAEIAHDLRTPLCGLKMNLQLANSRERTNSEYRTFISNCSNICDEMQAMVESRLSLARLDSGQIVARFEPMVVDLLLHECWRRFETQADSRGFDVSWNLADSLEIETDASLLKTVLQNLFQNVVSHGRENGTVQIRLFQKEDCGVIAIENQGCEIGAGELPRIFDRFWRRSNSEQAQDEHSGLGLPIAKRITELIGGEIQANVIRDESFLVQLTFSKRQPSERLTTANQNQSFEEKAAFSAFNNCD